MIALFRMFGVHREFDIVKANKQGEYEVAEGISATLFRAILVKNKLNYFLTHSIGRLKVL